MYPGKHYIVLCILLSCVFQFRVSFSQVLYSGQVLDAGTNEPLSNVKVELLEREMITWTNQYGRT